MSNSAVAGKPVVVTRDEPDDGPLTTDLRRLGLQVLQWRVLRIGPPRDEAPFAEALANIADFDWVVFASQHAVAAVTQRVSVPPPQLRVAAVGERTAQALRDKGWRVDLVPEVETAEHLVDKLTPVVGKGTRVLFPASSRSLPTINERLTKLGVDVHQVEAYANEGAALDVDACRAWVDRKAIGAVTFTSPSAVHELHRALGDDCFDRLLTHSTAIVLGPTTARAVSEHGFEPVLAEPANLKGVAATTYRMIQTR